MATATAKKTPVEGDVVLIPKGSKITGQHPSLPKEAKKNYHVTVDSFEKNEVTWIGSGGYYHSSKTWRWPE